MQRQKMQANALLKQENERLSKEVAMLRAVLKEASCYPFITINLRRILEKGLK